MSIDDNDNEQKNIDTYKVLSDQMARLALNFNNKDTTDENAILITYDDLAGKNPTVNPSLKTGGEQKKDNNNKGKVKFGQVIKASSSNKFDSKKSNKSNQNISKVKSENLIYNPNNNEFNPNLKNSVQNYPNNNSVANTNTNTSRDKIINPNHNKNNIINKTNNNNDELKNIINKKNTSDSIKTATLNPIPQLNSINNIPNNNVIISNSNQANFSSSTNVIPNQTNNKNTSSNNIIKPTVTSKSINNINSSRNNNLIYIEPKNIQSSINENNNIMSDTINSEDLEPIEIEIVNPDKIEDESNNSGINPFIYNNNKIINKGRQYTLYEREMKNLQKKRNKLDKERQLVIQRKLNSLQPGPIINEKSHEIVSQLGEYVPIQERAAQIHSRHLTQIILHDELKRMEKQKQEEEELKMIESYRRKNKKYDKEKWDSFVDGCNKWNEEVKYKRKAAEIYRNNMEKKINYKPKINLRSKKIMKKLQKGNNSVDDVFTRLYNDYEEHKERQKVLDEDNMPSFSPKINNVKYFNRHINRKSSNNSMDKFLTNNKKNNFFLESQMKIIGGNKSNNKNNKIKKNKSRDIKKANKFVNKGNTIKNKIVAKPKKIGKPKENRSYKPTMATNNSTIPINTEGNTIGFSNRYITNENPLMTTDTIQYYIPTNANNNFFSDDKINEMSESNSIQNNQNNNFFADINEDDESISDNKKNYNDFFDNINKDNAYYYNNNLNNTNFNNNNSNNKYNNGNKSHYNNYNNNYDNIYNYSKYDNNNYNNINDNKDNFKYNTKNNKKNNNKFNNNKINPYNNNFSENKNNYNNNFKENDNNYYDNNNQDYFDEIDNKKNVNKYIPKKRNNSEEINRMENNGEEEEEEKDEIENKNNDNKKNNENNSNMSNMNCCIGTEEMFKEENLLKELNDAQIKNKERKENKDKDESNNSLYKLNIMDSTPENMKENVVLTTDKYKNFFDIEGINEL